MSNVAVPRPADGIGQSPATPGRGVELMLAVALAAAAPVSGARAQAPELQPGTYRCSSYNVSSGGGSCRTMPPLVLRADGSYEYSSTRGRWSVRQGTLLLSQSSLWGPGKILGPDAIRFEYDYRGWHHVVTWTCQACGRGTQPQAGAAPTPTAARGSYVGIALVLEFGTAVGGVSSFTIVPAELAAGYEHDGPVPAGSVQGLAWATSPTTVRLATSKENKLLSGKQYVVFLDWPAETVPVAILDLPPVKTDYSATLPATLDGAAVLARVNR